MRSGLALLLAFTALAPSAFARSRAIGHRPLPWHAPACTEINGLPWFRFIDPNDERRTGQDPEIIWRVPTLVTEALEVGAGANVLWAVTSDGAIRQSMDAGCNWSVKAAVPEILANLWEPRILARHTAHVYVYTTPQLSFFGSDEPYLLRDKAMLIRLDYDAVMTFPFPEHILEMGVDPADGLRLRAIGYTGAIYDSSDGGASWQRHGTAGFGTLRTARIDPANLDRIVIGARAGGLRVTTNGGVTILEPPAKLATAMVSHIYFSPASPNVLWADAYNAGTSGLHRSNDGGLTFALEQINANAVSYTDGVFAPHPDDDNIVAVPGNRRLGLEVIGPGVKKGWYFENVKKVLWSPSGTLYFLAQVNESR